MATLPTPEENARMILALYQKHGRRPGEVLMSNNLQSLVMAQAVRAQDVNDGLKWGYEQGWFEQGPNGSHRLTDAGYAEM